MNHPKQSTCQLTNHSFPDHHILGSNECGHDDRSKFTKVLQAIKAYYYTNQQR